MLMTARISAFSAAIAAAASPIRSRRDPVAQRDDEALGELDAAVGADQHLEQVVEEGVVGLRPGAASPCIPALNAFDAPVHPARHAPPPGGAPHRRDDLVSGIACSDGAAVIRPPDGASPSVLR